MCLIFLYTFYTYFGSVNLAMCSCVILFNVIEKLKLSCIGGSIVWQILIKKNSMPKNKYIFTALEGSACTSTGTQYSSLCHVSYLFKFSQSDFFKKKRRFFIYLFCYQRESALWKGDFFSIYWYFNIEKCACCLSYTLKISSICEFHGKYLITVHCKNRLFPWSLFLEVR